MLSREVPALFNSHPALLNVVKDVGGVRARKIPSNFKTIFVCASSPWSCASDCAKHASDVLNYIKSEYMYIREVWLQ